MRIEGGLQTPGAAQGTTAATRDHAKLVEAAQQFEAMLLQQMLKPFQQTEAMNGGQEDGDGGGSASTLSSFGTEAVAKAISRGGGLGIARQIVQKVTAQKENALEKTHSTKVLRESADKFE